MPDADARPQRTNAGRAPLALALLAAAGAVAFLALAAAVCRGWTQDRDQRVLLALRSPADPARLVGPAALQPLSVALTTLGGGLVLAPVVIVAATVLGRRGRRDDAVWLVAATLGAFLLAEGLKPVFARPRPTVVPHLERVASPSFPSSHTVLATAVYPTLAAIAAARLATRRRRAAVWAAAAALAGLVGASRVALGVHYPTDVLAGWAGGAAWAIVCGLAARYLTR